MTNAEFIKWYDSSDLSSCGNKFKNLATISNHVCIPKGFCLTSEALKDSIPQVNYSNIEGFLTLLKSNGGYQLNRICKQINNELKHLKISSAVMESLLEAVRSLNLDGMASIIVRSSSTYEDTGNVSGAGIYESKGEIYTEADLSEAILYCWKSFFSLSALAHRLRIKEYSLENLPGLIVQKYLQCTISGVTFSEDPVSSTKGILTEYAKNGSDGIESGRETGQSFKIFLNGSDYISSNNDLPCRLVEELAHISQIISDLYSKPMEFEWLVSNDVLYVLQTRPITTTSESNSSSKERVPYLETLQAYTDYDYLIKQDLGDVTEVYLKSINKRKLVRDLAVSSGMNVHGVSVIRANLEGIDKFDINNFGELNRVRTHLLTIDLGPHIRSFYTTRDNINVTLKLLLRYSINICTFIVREFASGDYSAISSLVDEKTCVIEICRGSLIGINRGFVETNTYKIDLNTLEVNTISPREFPRRYYDFDEVNQCFAFKEGTETSNPDVIEHGALLQIARFTKTVNNAMGNISLEWTILNGVPIFIDHTNLAVSNKLTDFSLLEDDSYFLSKGKIEGKALIVKDIDRFEYISSGPTLNVSGHAPAMNDNPEIVRLLDIVSNSKDIVIVSKYPYTAFSVLVDKVKGFVFESGPLLCHLSIVCREQKTPVAIVPNALTAFKEGDIITL
jgi:hypothetical protein